MDRKSQAKVYQRLSITAALALPALMGFMAQAAPGAERLKYNRDIRPILSENCFPCHGPDSAARKAGLRLDKFEEATANRNGHAAIVKGNPAASELVKRVSGLASIMPPAPHKPLRPQEIATLKRWIAEGAEYEKHWSYIAPVRPPVPGPSPAKSPITRTSTSTIWNWCRNPIDNFILDKMLRAGLTPAPEADRRTLARRLSLDLVGLPPEPADVEAFVNDKSPNAYEKLVDKYLANPHWGEHRGRYWLDAARYADTHGIHFDNYREMWTYRDWVIQAFNKNMPFDQFTIEQLGGDLLLNEMKQNGALPVKQPGGVVAASLNGVPLEEMPNLSRYPKHWVLDSPLDIDIATGFNRCNITSNEGGLIPEEYIVLYARDRTETTSFVWLGSTMNCAVCHDHKFDPITQKDFYSMSAMFNNTTQGAMDGNIKDTPPILPVPMEKDRPRLAEIVTELATAKSQAESRKQAAKVDFDQWPSKADTKSLAGIVPTEGLKFHLPLSEGQGREVSATIDGAQTKLTAMADPKWDTGQTAAKAFRRTPGSVIETTAAGDFDKDKPFTAAAWVKIPRGDTGGAIFSRMDDQHDYRGWDLWLEGGRPGTHIVSKWPEDALKVVSKEPIPPGQWHHVCITYGGGSNVDSVAVYIDGNRKELEVQANQLKSTIRTIVPFKIGQRHSTSAVDGTAIQDVRLYGKALTQEEVTRLAGGTRAAWLASKSQTDLTGPEKDELFGWWLGGSDERYRSLTQKIAALEKEDRDIRARGTVAHVMQERSTDAMAYILFRGEYDKRRDPVKPATPEAMPPMPADYPKNRLGLARWLVRPEHPLTARVTVNRFWQEIFGTGLVRTSGDFGITGELPSHPELLDWLACEFRDPSEISRQDAKTQSSAKPWDVKRFFKMLVMSATYRQSSVTTPEKRQRDPANRLLAHGPRYRMDAEMVRDYALAASGLWVPKIGGPSVRPYQPDGVWEAVAMPESNTRNYRRDMGESLYRRSMYTFWKRAAPPASMEIFNAPNRETCTVRRERTDTPLQALVTLNDVQFVEAARALAQRALKEGGTTADGQIDFVARRLLARPLRAEELAVVKKSLSTLGSYYAGHSKEAQELISTGESKPDTTIKPQRLAAWTMLCNQMMNLDEVLNK